MANRATALLTLYTRPGCHLCDQAREVLARMQTQLGFALQEIDIDSEQRLHDAYFERIPVVVLDGIELLHFFVDEHILREALESR